ncbi:FecR family protein [Salegentibacter sp. F188]|uniref:FecR family protein n=1 Tax=Autumnicola patrickiae TaxID=3075591 RepID=A0ABU3DZC6_9FLAO|nr:FecR family protein [Salegentibacter sp. F188]MDT0689089.1 FecR family protein [Salegentibacter sp. F188]
MKNHEFNEEEFEEAWNSPYSTISENEIEDSWSSFKTNIIIDKKSGRNYAKASAAAALLILLFTSYFFLEIYNPVVTIENFAKVDKEVVLPDGSLVLLKKGSEISYKSSFNNTREVELKGEAFFDVITDSIREFKVSTKFTTTIALGTAFLVTEKPGLKDTEVTLFSGRILVSVNGLAKSWALIKGEKFIYKNENAIVKEFNTTLSFDAGDSYKDLNNIELEKLFTFLEKRFGYKFITSAYTLEKRVTLRINKADSLEEILNLLSIINNLNYEINQETKEIGIFSK